ncbi:MAG: ribonuclease HI family protein [Leptonema sp. (in: bacteria)]
MGSKNTIVIFCDGASKGNPGHSGIGAVAYLLKDFSNKDFLDFMNTFHYEKKLFELSQYIGVNSNNFAEYTSLKLALEKVLEIFQKNQLLKDLALLIFMDSELVVNQLNGIYKVKNSNLKNIYNEVQEILKKFPNWKIQHIPREQNQVADRLANLSLKKIF